MHSGCEAGAPAGMMGHSAQSPVFREGFKHHCTAESGLEAEVDLSPVYVGALRRRGGGQIKTVSYLPALESQQMRLFHQNLLPIQNDVIEQPTKAQKGVCGLRAPFSFRIILYIYLQKLKPELRKPCRSTQAGLVLLPELWHKSHTPD